MKSRFLTIVAVIGALAHVYFAYKEAFGWDFAFVAGAAEAWVKEGKAVVDRHIEWAAPLAKNMAAYNLVLAIGLGWTAVAEPRIARQLGFFFSAWLLIAAAAALFTGVKLAAALQGGLGSLLLVASVLSPRAAPPRA